jgi:hypothetical protein
LEEGEIPPMHDGTRWEPAVFDRRWSRMNHIRLDRHAADERIRPALGAVERRASGRVARLRDAPREHAARWAREAVARRAAELEEAQRHEVAAEPPAAEPVAAPRAAPRAAPGRSNTKAIHYTLEQVRIRVAHGGSAHGW